MPAVPPPGDPTDRGSLDVVISVASHDSLEVLCQCLASLPAACSGLRWDAVVLQNVPRQGDELIEQKFPWVTVIRNPHPIGFGANHNAVLGPVIEESRARYALVLNDDTELSPGAITSLVACTDGQPTVGAMAPLTFWPDGTPQPVLYSFPTRSRSFLASLLPGVPRAFPLEDGQGWLRGSCLLLRVQALKDVGIFDTQFFLFFEDTDMCARLWRRGWTVSVCDRASIVHAEHATLSRPDLIAATERNLLRSQYLYQRKYFGARSAYLLSQWNRVALLLRAVLHLRPRKPRRHADPSETSHLLELAKYRPPSA